MEVAMRHAPGAPRERAPAVYALPEHAHVELVQLREHLRLMVQLTDVGTRASAHDARLRPDAMAWWFLRLSRDISAIVDATYWSDALAQALATKSPRKSRPRKP